MAVRKFDPFDDGPLGPLSIEDRFSEQGRLRQELVWKTYVTQEGVGAPLYDQSGGLAGTSAVKRRAFCEPDEAYLHRVKYIKLLDI